MTISEANLKIAALEAENFSLREKVFGICNVYKILRPVLKFAKFFSFIKPGMKKVIDAAIAVLDEACPT